MHDPAGMRVDLQIDNCCIGLMGAGSTANNVLLLLAALERVLKTEGLKIKESGVNAAVALYAEQ